METSERHSEQSEESRRASEMEMGADVAVNVQEVTISDDRIGMVRELTRGIGADVVVEAAGVPEVVPEGLNMLRAGGFYIQCGNFSDMGGVSFSPHLVCSKSIRIIGIGGEAITAYAPSLEAFRRYRKHYPLDKIVTRRYPVMETEAATQCSMSDESMKVVIASAEHL